MVTHGCSVRACSGEGAKMSAEAGKKRGGHASTSGDRKSKRKPKRKETYSVYIYKVLKQVSKCFASGKNCFTCKTTSAHCVLTL